MVILDIIPQSLILFTGLCLVAFGFWGSTHDRPFLASGLAWCAPLGLVVGLIGLVWCLIPNFFTG